MESTARRPTEATGRGSTVSQYGQHCGHVSEYQASAQICSPRLQLSEALPRPRKTLPGRATMPRSPQLPFDVSRVEKTEELACESEDENPFHAADDIELLEKDTLFVPTLGMLDLPDTERGSRNGTPRDGRGTTPADQAPKPQSALGEALDEYLQRTKSPENYLTMKGKLDFIHQARILKCEKTIIKCRKEQERLQKEKQEREEKRWGKKVSKRRSCLSAGDDDNTEADTLQKRPTAAEIASTLNGRLSNISDGRQTSFIESGTTSKMQKHRRLSTMQLKKLQDWYQSQRIFQ
jgi:hypothetical protein